MEDTEGREEIEQLEKLTKEIQDLLKALEKRVAYIEYHNHKPKEYR